MDILAMMRRLAVRVCVASLCLTVATACDSWLYEDEGDCTVTYRLRFRYDMNLKWADAFANEVSSVHLYAFSPSGVLVWHCDEVVDPATADGYSMALDLPAGDYRLLAWCGLRNDGAREESFSVPEVRVGETTIGQLQCALSRTRDDEGAHSGTQLYRLFHGALDVSLPADEDGGSYDYTMYLTKDTNHVRVILQHLSGKDVDVDRFDFRIEDDNGLMAHHNGLLPDENITYHPWKTQSGEAGVDTGDSRATVAVKGAVADLTVGRMVDSHRRRMYLTISRKEGGTVARVPVIDYALLAKDYYEEEYGHRMSDQEFLDREDDYVMTFFLDDSGEWISSFILIHSWRVVTSENEIE